MCLNYIDNDNNMELKYYIFKKCVKNFKNKIELLIHPYIINDYIKLYQHVCNFFYWDLVFKHKIKTFYYKFFMCLISIIFLISWGYILFFIIIKLF